MDGVEFQVENLVISILIILMTYEHYILTPSGIQSPSSLLRCSKNKAFKNYHKIPFNYFPLVRCMQKQLTVQCFHTISALFLLAKNTCQLCQVSLVFWVQSPVSVQV